MIERETATPRSYLEAVGELARREGVYPDVVEDLLRDELGDWVRSFHMRPIDIAALGNLLRDRLRARLQKHGICAAAAALLLGLTDESFDALLQTGILKTYVRRDEQGKERFLKEELDAFVSSFLPDFKTWGTRTSLLKEFHRNLAAQTRFEAQPQPCEIGGCAELAAVICANPSCRDDRPPRKVCFRHREQLRADAGGNLCEECVRRVLYGDLSGRFEIVGTEDRLKKDHPQ